MTLPEVQGALDITSKLADSVNIISTELQGITDSLLEYQKFLGEELERLGNE